MRPGLTRNWRANRIRTRRTSTNGTSAMDHIFSATATMCSSASANSSIRRSDSPLRFPSGQDGDGTGFDHRGQNMAFGWNHIFTPHADHQRQAGLEPHLHQPPSGGRPQSERRPGPDRRQPVAERLVAVQYQRHAQHRHLELHPEPDRLTEPPVEYGHQLDQGQAQRQVRLLAAVPAELLDQPAAGVGPVRLQRQLFAPDAERSRRTRAAGRSPTSCWASPSAPTSPTRCT